VTKVERHPTSTDAAEKGHTRWTINGGTEIYDAIIVTVGTCGTPKKINFPGQDKFQGKVYHSSELDQLDDRELEGKKLVIIGSGASGVEAAELAVDRKAAKTIVLARFVPSLTVQSNFRDAD
jgi:dimethylaniline monooxygenase (N-oxide forming)